MNDNNNMLAFIHTLWVADILECATGGYSDLSWAGVYRSSLKIPTIFKGDFGRKGYLFLRIFLEK